MSLLFKGLAITMACHVPADAAFTAQPLPVDQVSGKLDTRLMIHNLRIAPASAAAAPGVRAISR